MAQSASAATSFRTSYARPSLPSNASPPASARLLTIGRPNGGDIVVQVRPDGGAAVITVADRGIGIDADDVHRPFRPFSRLSNCAKLSGTGLGLFISQGIVEAHGGRISVESHGPGTGTTFITMLPLGGPVEAGRLSEEALA